MKTAQSQPEKPGPAVLSARSEPLRRGYNLSLFSSSYNQDFKFSVKRFLKATLILNDYRPATMCDSQKMSNINCTVRERRPISILGLLILILYSFPASSVDLRRMKRSDESHRVRRESVLPRAGRRTSNSALRNRDVPNQIVSVEDAVIDGGRVSSRRRNMTNLAGLQDAVLDRQSTRPPSTPSPEIHSLERCSPRKRLVTVQRYGCRGTAVISVCEGACVTSVKYQPRRFPFLTTVPRSCQMKTAERVKVRVVCSKRSAERVEQRRAEGRADRETWNWLIKSKTMRSATSCHCTDCSEPLEAYAV